MNTLEFEDILSIYKKALRTEGCGKGVGARAFFSVENVRSLIDKLRSYGVVKRFVKPDIDPKHPDKTYSVDDIAKICELIIKVTPGTPQPDNLMTYQPERGGIMKVFIKNIQYCSDCSYSGVNSACQAICLLVIDDTGFYRVLELGIPIQTWCPLKDKEEQGNTIEFNLNDEVLVKLTDRGKWILRRNYEVVPGMVKLCGEYKEPDTDEEGWSKFQMHELMKEFGSSMGAENSFNLPIETTIKLPFHSGGTISARIVTPKMGPKKETCTCELPAGSRHAPGCYYY